MPEATRAVALSEAVKVIGAGDYGKVLVAAEAFRAFIEDSKAPASAPAPAKAAPAAKAAAPAKTAAKPAKSEEQLVAEATKHEPEPDDAAEIEAKRKRCAEIIDALLKAKKRAEAVELLGKFGAKSMTSVKPEDYDALIAEGEDLLPLSE
jgi:hypothetical protein